MEFPLWLNNLISYSLQIAIVVAAGTLLLHLFRLRLPRVTLVFWQILLFVCLILPILQRWEHPVSRRIVLSGTSQTIAGIPVPTVAEAQATVPWEMLVWILAAGIILRLLWLMIGFFRLHLFQRKSSMFLEEHEVVRDMQWRTGVRVTLLLSGEIDSPVTFGLHSPKIILPLSFRTLSGPMQKAVLCHELLHVRRHDWILIIVEEIICSIFWFHPAIWWLRNRIHLSREQSVDHEVVRVTGSRQPYLDSLLEFAKAQGRPRAVPAPLFLKERHLVQRVALLLKEISMSRSRLAASIVGTGILFIGTVHLAVAWFPLTGEPVSAPELEHKQEVKIPAPKVPLPVQNQSPRLRAKTPSVMASVPARAQTVAEAAPADSQPAVVLKAAPPKRTPISVGGNIQESKLIHKIAPVYPERAKRDHIQGTIKFTIIINEEGLVYEIRTQGENDPILEEAAIEAVKQWKYSPTILNGEPVPVMATVTVLFRLKDSSSYQSTPPPSGTTVWKRDPIQVGGNAQESKLIHKVEPIYPEPAKKARVQGKITLRITVNEEGNVSEVQVLEGHPLLSDSAVDAVRQWKYSPTLLNGQPVPVMATVTLVFTLR